MSLGTIPSAGCMARCSPCLSQQESLWCSPELGFALSELGLSSARRMRPYPCSCPPPSRSHHKAGTLATRLSPDPGMQLGGGLQPPASWPVLA